MDTSAFLLTNGKVVFALQNLSVQQTLVENLLQFLAPCFSKTTSGTPQFSLTLRDFSDVPADWQDRACTPITIRKSTVESFYLTALTFAPDEDQLVALDAKTATAYHLYQKNAKIEMYLSERSFVHVIELVRYLSLMIEEALGTMVLHATATVHAGSAYLVLGHRGAGKTTTMIHLISDHAHQYLSGDKVLVSWEDTGLLVRGWPDYPHVGIGTLRRFPAFAQTCGVSFYTEDGEAKKLTQKEVLDFAVVRQALHVASDPAASSIAALIFPSVSADETSMRVMDETEKGSAVLLEHIEYPHQFGLVQWHALLPELRCQQRRDYAFLLNQLKETLWLYVAGVGLLPTETFDKVRSF